MRAQLLHGVAVAGPPECEIAAPQVPWQREIESVKLRRLPWGLQSLCLAWGGSSPGRRRASNQALPLPAFAMCPQTTPLLQNMLPKSLLPPECLSLVPRVVSQPDLLDPHSSPAHLRLAPSPGMSPRLPSPLLTLKRPLQCLQETFLCTDLYKTPTQGLQRTRGEKSERALMFPLLKAPTALRTHPASDCSAIRPAIVCSPPLLMVLSITLLSPSSPTKT